MFRAAEPAAARGNFENNRIERRAAAGLRDTAAVQTQPPEAGLPRATAIQSKQETGLVALTEDVNLSTSHTMKGLTILIAGLVAVFLSSCSSTPKDNYNQAMESDLVEATIFMKTLNALDAGDVSKARRMAMMPVFMNLGSMRLYTTKGWGSVTTEQKEEWTKLAKQTLDYMIRHESEFDSRRLDVQQGLRGLRYLLTEPEDVRRLDELSAYFQKTQKPWPDDSH